MLGVLRHWIPPIRLVRTSSAQTLWRTVCELLTELNMHLSYNPAITLFAIYPRKWKAYCLRKNLYSNVQSSLTHNIIQNTGNKLNVLECVNG